MDERPVIPYGAWPSPITPQLMSAGTVRLGQVAVNESGVWWLESRPAEAGRTVLVRRGQDGNEADVTPAGYNVRTLVHEYGGGAFAVRAGTVWFSNFDDQRLYRQGPGAEPVAVTPEPAHRRADRYADADLSGDGRLLFCVRERHRAGTEPVNELVVVPADGSVEPVPVASGHDFYAFPRVSPDGNRLAWLTWDHPRMPWDGADLWVADLAADGTLSGVEHVAGGPDEAVSQPAWSPDGVLHFISDPTGWWNLYRVRDGGVEALTRVEAELGAPQWVFGQSAYAFLDDGRIACVVTDRGVDRFGVLVPGGEVSYAEVPWTACSTACLRSDGRRLAFVAASATQPDAVVVAAGDLSDWELVRRSLDVDLDPGDLSMPERIEFPTADGLTAHAFYHRPANRGAQPPAGERPPLIVGCHGGPTGHTRAALQLDTQFWTSRGFAFAEVNYGGSSGYGRAYRERLAGAWGVTDTVDCVNAARFLAERGDVDPARMAIRGGSAGGWTTLCALTFHDAFAAGSSHFGVADAALLATETHKFESRYLDGLIGPWPDAEARYRERSPIHHTDRLSCPLIVLQGLEDEVVPPSQAEALVAALRARGVPYAYLAFEGEQHGFRRAESIRRAYEAELSFFGQVFGFTPAGELEAVDVVGL